MYQSIFKIFTSFMLATVVAAITSTIVFGQEFRVEGAGLEANPTNYSGKCPVVITFKGKIQANRKGLVKYTWIRSDGATSPVESIVFTGSEIKYVSTTWTLGDATALPSYIGMQKLKILAPNELVSNEAGFKIQCVKPNSTSSVLPFLIDNFPASKNTSDVTTFLHQNGDFSIFADLSN